MAAPDEVEPLPLGLDCNGPVPEIWASPETVSLPARISMPVPPVMVPPVMVAVL